MDRGWTRQSGPSDHTQALLKSMLTSCLSPQGWRHAWSPRILGHTRAIGAAPDHFKGHPLPTAHRPPWPGTGSPGR